MLKGVQLNGFVWEYIYFLSPQSESLDEGNRLLGSFSRQGLPGGPQTLDPKSRIPLLQGGRRRYKRTRINPEPWGPQGDVGIAGRFFVGLAD